MAGVKQTFKYRDPRETRLLNQSQKDNLGRQRNHVLYGFSWKSAGSNRNQILMGPGAIYTQDGVKIFFDDETTFSVPVIDPGQGLTGGPARYDDFPYPKNIIIGIQHDFTASSTAQEAKLVLIEVRTSQKDQEPAYYILEVDTITLNPTSNELSDPDRPSYNGLYDTKTNARLTTPNLIAEGKLEYSIPYNVTPIFKVRIQQVHNGGIATIPPYLFTGGGQLEDGVEVIRYKNIWQQTNDMLGVNLFEPLISSDQNSLGDLHYPVNARDSQAFVKNASTGGSLVTNAEHTPTQHPLFGSFDPNVPNNYAAYRFSNFLMDGRSILEGMKRLDAWLRLLVNRTGEQSLVSLVDSLDELNDVVQHGTTGDQITYGANFMLQDGTVHHIDPGNGGSYGDTHRRALHFLDKSIEYIATRLGLTPMMKRDEIEIDNVTVPELWDVSNPPGLDITQNMNFHDALQTLRDYFTSRGNDVITGIHVYSIDDSVRNAIPNNQKTIVNDAKVEVTDDTTYIKLENGSIDSSDVRSDKIAGNEVATLDSASRYRVNKIASHDAARIAAGQGPKVEGVINASQGLGQVGLGNIIGYTRNWSQDQLREWANILGTSTNPVPDVSHASDGLRVEFGTDFEPEIYHYVYKDSGGDMTYAFSIDNLTASGNACVVSLVFYDGAFVEVNETVILNTNTNGKKVVNGLLAPIGTAKFFRLRMKNTGGTFIIMGGISFWRNRVESHIYDNEATTGASGTALTRKDYVDTGLALKQDNLTYDGSSYVDNAGNHIGYALKIVVGGVDRFIPSYTVPTGTCHGNHSNCNCHGDACNMFAV